MYGSVIPQSHSNRRDAKDAAPGRCTLLYAGDGAPIRAGMGNETRDDSLSSTAAEINVTFFVNVRINEN